MSNNIVSTIPSFIGGVSQQSPALRLKTQCDALDNGHATISDGLIKRPNADLVAVLGSITAPTGMKVHKIYRDVSEKYIAIFTSDSTNPIRVFELDGTEISTVRYGYYDSSDTFIADNDKKKYLSDGGITDAKKEIKAVSVADYTIVINTQKTTATKDTTTTAQKDAAYVYFKGVHKGQYQITYKFTVDDANHSVTKSHTVAYVDGVLNYDCDSLLDDFKDDNPDGTYLTLTGTNSVLKVAPKAGVDANSLRVHVSDPYGGQDLIPINYAEVDSIDSLPPSMPEDVVIKVGGDGDIAQDDYYMKFHYEEKKWVEDVGFGLSYEFDPDTMPHRLMRTGADQFTFATINWEDRTVGDDDTNPEPSFIGSAVSNVAFVKNRLWFISGENVIGSKAGDYFNFFASTVMDILDDDPIDVAAAGEQVTKFRSGKGFDGGLFLISDEEQFALTSGEQLLTPKTVAIDSTTAYTADTYCDPIKLGSDIYFISPKGAYISVRDYTIMPDTLMKNAYDITAHVPKYIPLGDAMLTGCNILDMLFVHTSGDNDAIFTHKFLWDGDNKVQQAWYRWVFADEVKGMVVFGTVLYVLFYNATDGYILESINLENIVTDSQDFRYHLDHLKAYDNGVYDDTDTTFDLEVDVGADGSGWTVIDASDNSEVTSGFTLANTTLTFADTDVSDNTYYVGKDYEMRMRFSQFYVRDGNGNAMIAGNLVTRNLTLSFKDTGYFVIEVTPFNRDTNSETFSNTYSGVKVGESELGAITLLTGEEEFPIIADSRRTIIELVSDSYLPVAIQLGAWFASWVYNGRII